MEIQEILIFGSSGQLGSSLVKILAHKFKLINLSRKDLDLNSKNLLENLKKNYSPSLVINCAAYTDVEKAEIELNIAKKVNAFFPRDLAIFCKYLNIPLIHISTDYVYDGKKNSCYYENDQTNPINNYGLTKLMGEELIKENLDKYLILRTSWLYNPEYGNNFYRTMIDKFINNNEIMVVNDQFGRPTSTKFLSNVINKIINQIDIGDYEVKWGLYNIAEKNKMSWFEFAESIFLNERDNFSFKLSKIIPVSSDSYVTKAIRPKNSCLNSELIFKNFSL